MLAVTKESSEIYQEYRRVFGKIDRSSLENLKLEREAMELMREMQRMDAKSSKIEKEARRDKIENFNNKYINLKFRLHKIYSQIYA